MNTESLIKNIHKFESDIEGLNSSLETIVQIDVKKRYKLKGDGSEDISSIVQNLLNSRCNVIINDGVYKLKNIITKYDKQIIKGNATLVGEINVTMIEVNNNDCEILELDFNSNGALYAIKINQLKKSTFVYNNKFYGDGGHYVFDLGDNTRVAFNGVDCTNYGVISPFVFHYANNFKFTNNDLVNSTGFNVQTRFCNKGLISNNDFINEIFTKTFSATQGQKTFTFNTIDYARKGVRVNGIPKGATYSYTGGVLTVVLDVACNSGDTVEIKCFRSLENININSNCYDITITNNIIDGTGDSGIVLCADYHNGNLDPGNVVETDFPERITVANNTIKNCAFSGIAETHAIKNVTIMDNNIDTCGIVTEGIYGTGILATGMKNIIGFNKIKNCLNGIVVNTFGLNTWSGDDDIVIYKNIFTNVTTKHFVYGYNDPTRRATNLSLITDNTYVYEKINIDGDWLNDMPINTDRLNYSKSGVGLTKIKDTSISQTNVIRTNKDSYGEIYLIDTDFFTNTVLELTFLAKSSVNGASANVQFYYSVENNLTPVTLTINSKVNTFTRNTFKINIPGKPTPNYGTGLFFRIIGVENYVYIKDIEIKAITIN